MKTKIAAFILMLLCNVIAKAQEYEPFIPESNYHPSFVGCRITPDSIRFYPQNPTDVVSFVYKSKLTSGALFNNAKQWVAKNFKNYKDVVQMEDINSHTIVFKGNVRQKIYKNSKHTTFSILYYTATVECKEKKYRIKLEDFSIKEMDYIKIGTVDDFSDRTMTFRELHDLINGNLVKSTSYKKFLNDIREEAKENTAVLINSLASAMNTADDF